MGTRALNRSMSGWRLSLLAGSVATAVSGVHAQNNLWLGGDGYWSNGAQWSLGTPANGGGVWAAFPTAGPQTIQMDIPVSLAGMQIGSAGTTVNMFAGASLACGGLGIANNGTIVINPLPVPAGTYLQCMTSQTLSGWGQLVLNAYPGLGGSSYITYYGGGEILTQEMEHTIRGTGDIYVSLYNRGLVSADRPGRVLRLLGQPKTNPGTFEAVGGGILQLENISLNQSSGWTRAVSGGIVQFNGTTIYGGLLSSMSGGSSEVIGTSSFVGVETEGPLTVMAGQSLRTYDSLTNNGTITINNDQSIAGTYLQIMNSQTLDGSGELFLNANPGNLGTSYIVYYGGGEVLTQAPQHLIHGCGDIYVSIVNSGTVKADLPGRMLRLRSQPKTNFAQMMAVNGGTLSIDSVGLTQSGGSLLAQAGSSVVLNGATIAGGDIIAVNGGTTNVTATSSLVGVHTVGPMNVAAGEGILSYDSLRNDGTITINPDSSIAGTYVQLRNSQTLSGTGQMVLNGHPSNLGTAYLIYYGGGELLTQAAEHTIRGTGSIFVALDNWGLVAADTPGSLLMLSSQPKTNHSIFEASNGGTLLLDSVSVTLSGGQIRARQNGLLRILGSTVYGGLISSDGTSRTDVVGGSAFVGCALAGRTKILDGSSLRTYDGLVNNGTIVVNDAAGSSDSHIQFMNSQTISGTGDILLNASGNLGTAYLVYYGGGEFMTLASPQLLHGTGEVFVGMTNQSRVSADVPGAELKMLAITKQNLNEMTADFGGKLVFENVTVTQSPAASIVANEASQVLINSSTIYGGTLGSNYGGAVQFIGGSALVGLSSFGRIYVAGNSWVRLYDQLVNDGDLIVNHDYSAADSHLQFMNSLSVEGSGRIILNGQPTNFGTAYLVYYGGGEQLRIGGEQTLAGNGRDYLITVIDGRLAPGFDWAVGRFEFRNTLTMGPNSSFDIKVAGSSPDQIDRFDSDHHVALDGTLNLSRVNGYVGSIGDTWTVISAPSISGEFAAINVPQPTEGSNFRVNYYPTHVDIEVICYADVNVDGGVDGSDINAFFEIWESGDLRADINNDGGVDGTDVDVFFRLWESGGC